MKKLFTLFFASILALASFGQDVIEVKFDSFYNDPAYTPEETFTGRNGNTITIGGDWIISMKNDNAQFTFDFYGASPESFTGTFTIDNIDTDFSYGYHQDTRVNYKTCDLTITESRPSATITRYTLVANIVSEDDINYLVTATHDILTATETVEAEILDAQITPTEYGFVLTAKKAELDLDISLSIKWNYGIEGYFRNYHVDSVNTAITHKGQTFIPSELVMDVVFAAALSSGKPGYSIPAMQFLSPDVVAYNLKIEAPIIVTDTIDITCTNLAWDDSQKAESSIMFEASNETYSIFGMLSATSIKKGTYDSEKASVELTNTATSENIGALITTVVVEGNMLKGFTAEVEVLGSDSKLYLIHLSKSNETTNVENIEITTDTNKMIINGALVIIKNGVKYNTMGQIIK